MMIYMNSRYLDSGEACVDPASEGFSRGIGVFETIRVRKGRPIFLQEHLRRLNEALPIFELEFDLDMRRTMDVAARLIEKNGVESGLLKIICSRGPEGKTDRIIHTGKKNYDDADRGSFGVSLAEARRNETSPLCGIKSISYAENALALRQAQDLGYEEAIFLNGRGFVSEGSRTNIFWIADGRVFTPSPDCGLLPGVARQKIIDLCGNLGIGMTTGHFTLDAVCRADEMFVTNSLMDIMPVSVFAINQAGRRIQYRCGSEGIAARLADAYRDMLDMA